MKKLKLKSNQDLKYFKLQYESLSGLDLPMSYLKNSDVYAFKKSNQFIGGFILGNKKPLRTIETFISIANLSTLAHFFEEQKYCEVCCFWVDRKYRKSRYYNAKLWLLMAYRVKRQEKEFILYGTNMRGLAIMYGYPKKSLLFHKDSVQGKDTFVFIARRKDFAAGVWEIVFSKLFKTKKVREFQSKSELKKTIFHELSK